MQLCDELEEQVKQFERRGGVADGGGTEGGWEGVREKTIIYK